MTHPELPECHNCHRMPAKSAVREPLAPQPPDQELLCLYPPAVYPAVYPAEFPVKQADTVRCPAVLTEKQADTADYDDELTVKEADNENSPDE